MECTVIVSKKQLCTTSKDWTVKPATSQGSRHLNGHRALVKGSLASVRFSVQAAIHQPHLLLLQPAHPSSRSLKDEWVAEHCAVICHHKLSLKGVNCGRGWSSFSYAYLFSNNSFGDLKMEQVAFHIQKEGHWLWLAYESKDRCWLVFSFLICFPRAMVGFTDQGSRMRTVLWTLWWRL